MAPKSSKRKRAPAKAKARPAPNASTKEAKFEQLFYSDTDSDDVLPYSIRHIFGTKPGRKPKRPRHLAAPTAPEVSDNEALLDNSSEDGPIIDRNLLVTLTDGPEGPQLKIDLAKVLVNGKVSINSLLHYSQQQIMRGTGNQLKQHKEKTAFTDLPAEITEMIYREVFVTSLPVSLKTRHNLARSSQFLRTCRKVYEQGTLILYGANSFHLERTHNTRGTYFQQHWEDIGYKDVRRFLNDIGPHNIAKIKYLSLCFEDALPTFTPRLTAEARKYFHDGVLIEVVNMIGRHTELEKFVVGFRGKQGMTESNYFLLKALCTIRCHEFLTGRPSLQRARPDLLRKIKSLIEIPPRMEDAKIDRSMKKFIPNMYEDISYY